MFSIRGFIMNTLKGMHGHYPDFQIREYALNWYAKGKLNEEDLAEVELMLNPPIPEVTEEEPTEELLN
jgi:hypothetical protein